MMSGLVFCNLKINYACAHQSASNFTKGVSFWRMVDTVKSSRTHFTLKLRETLGAFTVIASFKKRTRRQSCPNLSKVFSSLVCCLWLRPVAALKKKKQFTFPSSQSSKNPQCPNTKTQKGQGFGPAFTSVTAYGAERDIAQIFSRVLAAVFPHLSISRMNLVAASSKLAQIQANRGIPC